MGVVEEEEMVLVTVALLDLIEVVAGSKLGLEDHERKLFVEEGGVVMMMVDVEDDEGVMMGGWIDEIMTDLVVDENERMETDGWVRRRWDDSFNSC